MSGYAFHPDAFADLDEIWEYIAQDNVDAADRVLADRSLRFHVARFATDRRCQGPAWLAPGSAAARRA